MPEQQRIQEAKDVALPTEQTQPELVSKEDMSKALKDGTFKNNQDVGPLVGKLSIVDESTKAELNAKTYRNKVGKDGSNEGTSYSNEVNNAGKDGAKNAKGKEGQNEGTSYPNEVNRTGKDGPNHGAGKNGPNEGSSYPNDVNQVGKDGPNRTDSGSNKSGVDRAKDSVGVDRAKDSVGVDRAQDSVGVDRAKKGAPSESGKNSTDGPNVGHSYPNEKHLNSKNSDELVKDKKTGEGVNKR